MTTDGQRGTGFTLVEIMIVVSIIGLMSVIAIPSFQKARLRSKVNATANDFRVFHDAFQQYAMEAGGFSSDFAAPGVLPSYMSAYINSNRWSRRPETGGMWLYKCTAWASLDYRPAIGIVGPVGNLPDANMMLELDRTIDDGNLATGSFVRFTVTQYYMYLDQ